MHPPTPDRRLRSAAPLPGARLPWLLGVCLIGLCLIGLLGLGCASTGAPVGQAFEEAPPPGRDMARLYVYRLDAVSSGGAKVSLEIGDRELGTLRNQEYLTVLVEPGRPVLSARYRSLLQGSYKDVPLSLRPGSTTYVHLFADRQERIRQPGLAQESYSVGIFAAVRPAAEALPQLMRTSQQPPQNDAEAEMDAEDG